MEHSDFKLLTAQEKQDRYDIIKRNLEKFYASYGQDKFGLGQQAKYTIVSAAINNEFPYFNFVGFYTVEKRMVSKTGKDVKEGGCLAKEESGKAEKDSSDHAEELEEQSVLEIGPYQSDILATAHILIGKGVCGTCWKKKETRLINRVKECKNYIACDNVTKAEICVPVFDKEGEVKAVFDVDSLVEDCFCSVDQTNIELICRDFL